MTDSFVQLPADSTGQKADTEQLTVGSNTVFRQRLQLAGAAAAAIAAITNAAPTTEYGLVVRNIPSGTQPVSGTVTVAQLPAAAALADGTTNPTTGIVGALAEVYNGSTWDRRKSASAANLSAASGTGAALVSPPGAWTVTHNPAAATQATATKAAGGAGVRHVCTGICAAIAASGTASGTVTVVLRDGATGVGGLLYVQTLSVPVNSSASINFPCPPIYGTANAAMTLEFTAGGAAATFETITLMGYDAS